MNGLGLKESKEARVLRLALHDFSLGPWDSAHDPPRTPMSLVWNVPEKGVCHDSREKRHVRSLWLMPSPTSVSSPREPLSFQPWPRSPEGMPHVRPSLRSGSGRGGGQRGSLSRELLGHVGQQCVCQVGVHVVRAADLRGTGSTCPVWAAFMRDFL